MYVPVKPVAGRRVKSAIRRIVDLQSGYPAKTPKTSSEMTKAEKTSRVAQKKETGQPAGKPKRVAPLRRKKQSG